MPIATKGFADSSGATKSLRIAMYWSNGVMQEGEEDAVTSRADTGEGKNISATSCMQLPLDRHGLGQPENFKTTTYSSHTPLFALIVVHNKNIASNISIKKIFLPLA